MTAADDRAAADTSTDSSNDPSDDTTNEAATRRWDRDTLPVGDDKQQTIREMFDAIAPRYDLINRLMTFGLDTRWRRATVKALNLPTNSLVFDLASGTGDLCVDLRRAGHRPVSFDLSYGMLAADRSGAPRVQADILRLPTPDAGADGVVCGFALRNLVDLDVFFVELARAVRPGGRIALLDVGVPTNPVIKFGNNIYSGKVIPKIGAMLSDDAAYRYLPQSIRYLPPGAEMATMLKTAGFGDAEHRPLTGGITQLLTGTRDPADQ